MKNKNIHKKASTRPWWQTAVFIAGVLFGVVILGQFLYPTERALPFTRVSGVDVGGKSASEITGILERQFQRKVVFTAEGQQVAAVSLADIGVALRLKETTQDTVRYTPGERLLPFSLFLKNVLQPEATLRYRLDMVKLQQFVKNTLLPICNKKPIDASLHIVADEITVKGGSKGRECRESEVVAAIRQSALKPEIALPSKVLLPTRDRAMFEPQVAKAREKITQGMTIIVEGRPTVIPKPVLASWFVFQEEPQTKQIKLGVHQAKLSQYLAQLNSTIHKDAIAHQVFIIDGKPERRVEGKEGRTLNITQTAAAISNSLTAPGGSVSITAIISRVTPRTEYIRDYSGSQAGLSLLLQDLVAEKGQYGITVVELAGKRRQAHANGDYIFTTASTYKMFVAYSVLKQIEAGLIKWHQPIRGGMDTIACFDEMIRYSLNPCSWTFKDMVGGWARIEAQMRSLGLTNTYLVQNNLRSTSNDEALFLKRLEEGTSLTGQSRQFLLRLFREQIYRSGIPSGVSWPVANKIGFLEGFLHDVAIVYSPKGTYILAVMTYGGSWWQIADVARRVDAVMQR
ncbi:MAG TPA: serine hydrolase [Verrucomicrobiae bacterium]|nr:serine hydrolase [Verrucomicrobiae bacterium]